MKRSVLVLVAFCGWAFGIYAGETKKDTLEYKLATEIVITAPRMSMVLREAPFSAIIVNQEVLGELSRSVGIDEAMKLAPGVKVDNQANGNRMHLSIRGQGILTERGIRGIKILFDEIPINDPTGFAPDFFDIDFSTVDRIEVLKGPGASLYGGSASGGIINISSNNSPATPLFGQLNTSYGSNNFWKGFGEFGGSVNNVNYRISFSRTLGDGYRDHTHFWGNNAYGKLTYAPTENLKLSPIFGWTNFYHENPEGINLQQYHENPLQANPDAIPYNEHLETNRVTNGLTGLLLLGDHEVQFNTYVKRTLFTEANNRTFNHRTLLTPGGSLQYSLRSGKPADFFRNRFSVGTDLQWQTIDESRVDNLHSVEGDTVRSKERITQRGVGFFVLDKIDVNTAWSVLLSLRYDRIYNELVDVMKTPVDLSGDATFSKWTGRVGVTYAATPEANLYADWGQGFLPPATEELAQNPDNFGGFNKHLTYASSSGVELGIRGLLESKLYYDVTGFYLTTENDFDRYRVTDPLRNQETFYRNAGSSRRFGAELYADYTPTRDVDLQIAYTYSNFQYTNGTPIRIMMDDPSIVKWIERGNMLPNSPQHQLYVSAKYFISPEFTVTLAGELQSKTHIDGANLDAEAAEGFALLHARLAYHLIVIGESLQFSLDVRNVTDKTYIAFTEPDPGGNSYQPGAGRQFSAGLKIGM